MLRYTAGLVIVGIAAVMALIFCVLYSPIYAQNEVKTLIEYVGFENVEIPPPETGFGRLTYKNIKLDKNAFNTIKQLEIKYSPLKFLMWGQANSLLIKDLELTGEINKGLLSIAGFKTEQDARLLNKLFKADQIILDNAELSLLSKKHGGISITIDATTHATKSDGMAFSGKILNTQREMRYTANVNGQINRNRDWHSQIEITDLRIDTEDLKATRASGELTLSYIREQTDDKLEIDGELRAGNAQLLGLPWQTPSITLQGNPLAPSAIIGTKANGYEDIELGLAIKNINTPDTLSGFIYTQNLRSFLDYIKPHFPKLKPSLDIISKYKNIENIEFNFELNEGHFEFTMSHKSGIPQLHGYLQIVQKDNKNKITGFVLKNSSRGKVTLKNPAFFKMLKSSKHTYDNIEAALSNLHFDDLTLAGKFLENGKADFQIEILGKNPDLNNGRPFKTDFSFTATPEEFLKAIKDAQLENY